MEEEFAVGVNEELQERDAAHAVLEGGGVGLGAGAAEEEGACCGCAEAEGLEGHGESGVAGVGCDGLEGFVEGGGALAGWR